MNERVERLDVPDSVPPTAQLSSAIERVRSLLALRLGLEEPRSQSGLPADIAGMDTSALQDLCGLFRLSNFERDILVLCAAVELDPAMAPLCAALHGDERHAYPTFRIALAALPEGHWSAVLPNSPLRRWKLIDVIEGEALTTGRLRIEECVLHYLSGMPIVEPRLEGILCEVERPKFLPESYRAHAEKVLGWWNKELDAAAVVQLQGSAGDGKLWLAAAISGAVGLALYRMQASDVPTIAAELDEFARLWEREAVLNRCALVVVAENSSPAEWAACSALADKIEGIVFVAGSGPLELVRGRHLRISVDRPGADEQRALWKHALGPQATVLNGDLERVATQFSLDAKGIEAAGRRALQVVEADGRDLASALWEVCREDSRPALEARAQRIETRAAWHDLVLPEPSMEMLRVIATHVRQLKTVYEQWGFARRGSRGLGTAALFSGPSGTGKTMAAEVLANELQLDLYRIDLSQVVSKYIGETEKNLRAIFDAAENSGAILLFDEADALFGKRSEVKDSHDRYANIEVSYLLQRMEAYRGLAVLTTNMRNALDQAFLRRIRFVVSFPFPDPPLRRKIWERIFPSQTPTRDLNPEKLSRLNLPGGNIRNIALNAAFLAADAGEPVSMQHLLVAARRECGKLEKTLTDSEIGGWV